jgi:hypothetical protein
MKNPMVRVEALINQLAKKVGSESDDGRSQQKPIILTPESINVDITSERTPTNSGVGPRTS